MLCRVSTYPFRNIMGSLLMSYFSCFSIRCELRELPESHFLDIPHQKLYVQLQDWSVYYLKEMLLRFMVKQAVEHLKPVVTKSAATLSRAGVTLSVDNSVMDRFGKLLRCT